MQIGIGNGGTIEVLYERDVNVEVIDTRNQVCKMSFDAKSTVNWEKVKDSIRLWMGVENIHISHRRGTEMHRLVCGLALTRTWGLIRSELC